MTIPPPPKLPPEPPLRDMPVSELRALVESRNIYGAKAVFELTSRVGTDEEAIDALDALSRSPLLRNNRIHGYVSLAWGAIIGLLAGETPRSRGAAYDAYAALDPKDQELFLTYVKADRIEDAHPSL